MALKPLGDRIVVEPIEQDEITAGGIMLPDTAKEKPQEGKILAVGPGTRNDAGERVPLDVAVDDIVLYAKYAGTEIKLEGEDYLIVKEDEILGIIG